MNFDETIRYLFSLGHETMVIKLGLRNIELLLESLGNPQKTFESVQIAGTNGKGSTAVVIDSICRSAGIKTGLFTSPHLISVTERIRINGARITEDNFAKYVTEVRLSAENLVACGKLQSLPTFFEHLTAIALLAFRDSGVRLVILETGLGGRLDATTVARAGTVAITSLALDHQEYLGETLEQIAGEKAAIIRPGVTAIIAPQSPQALEVILRRCAECNVEASVGEWQIEIVNATDDGRFRVTMETIQGRYEHVLLGLRGRHQIVNVAVAIRLAESLQSRGFDISHAAIVTGIEKASHAGRLDWVNGSPSFLLDGAHNPAGLQSLREFLNEFVHQPLTLVFGAMKDKKLDEMAAIIFPVAHHLILTKTDNPRAASVADLRLLAESLIDQNNIIAVNSVGAAIRIARQVTPPEGLVCIAGSLYLVGEVKSMLIASALSELSEVPVYSMPTIFL